MYSKKELLKKLGQIAAHLLFWCFVLFFYTYFFGVGSNNYKDTLMFALFLMPITIATTYISIYKLIPEYLIKKKYFKFVLYSIYTLVISCYLIMISIFFSLIYLSSFKYSDMNPLTRNIILVTTVVYLVVIIVSAFKLLKLNLLNLEKSKNLENKVLETQLKLKEQELKYLKMQIHPHFLFNTLNTIYGFALKKADETPEMILKLSNLLDYLLYQVDKPFVSLTEEINHIKDYIALEQLRFYGTLDVSFITENIKKTTKVAPMLLMPFIENSFKHGELKNGKLKINIKLTYDNGYLLFSIKNTSKKSVYSKNGIGLDNIKKRLELLYNGQYTLDISNKEIAFEVTLNLKTKTLLQDA